MSDNSNSDRNKSAEKAINTIDTVKPPPRPQPPKEEQKDVRSSAR